MLSSILLSALAVSSAAAVPWVDQPMARSDSTDGSSPPSFISAAYLPGWEATDSSLASISWEKFDLITWSFAETTSDPSVLSLDGSGASFIPQFVQLAKQHNTMASISVGGWTGSGNFSSAVTPQNRNTFAKAILDMVSKYNLDGVDFDWEFPNDLGIGCNEKSGSDAENLLGLLQEIRADPAGKNLYLSAAVGLAPFLGSDGKPMTNASGFAAVLDHVTIMAYDINGQWTTNGVGPNSPLSDSCSTLQAGSAIDGVNAWVAADFPADKIVLGVPAYAHTFNVTCSNAINKCGKLAKLPPFTPAPSSGVADQCGNVGQVDDTVNFSKMIAQGILKTDGTTADGIYYRFDKCSQTPYAYNAAEQLMFSYDDPKSYAAKGKFITSNDLLGFSMWDITGDYNDLLVDALWKGAGVSSDC